MSNISKRSLTASKEGVQLASRAILKFPTKIDFAAELEISRSTVQNFFAGKPVGRENFHKICQELDLCWQDVAELPQEPLETALSTQKPKSASITVKTKETDSLLVKPTFQVRSKVRSVCSTMRVLDMSAPMSTEDIYVDINVYEKIKGRRRLEFDSINAVNPFSRINLLNLNETRQRQISGLEAADCYSKLVVLGKPGAGKTMFLKYLTLQCLQGKFASERIAIFISLRDYAESNSSLNLVDYITWHLVKDGRGAEREDVRLLLNQGRFFIAIDGLDEVKPAEHKRVYQYLRRFTEWYPNNRYVFSCRHGLQCCNFEQFTEVEIADFQLKQIVSFATKWFDLENANKGLNFLQKLKENPSIQELATNPLLLTLLCISFDEAAADFPTSRSEIYEEGLDIMLKQWDSDRSIERESGGLSWQHEKELLRIMALKTFEQKQYFFRQAELESHIANYLSGLDPAEGSRSSGKKLLKSIEVKYGLLVERAKKVYSFSHLAFQEYLTARNFIFEETTPASITMLQYLVDRLNDKQWREIFLLVAEMSPQADQLFQMMNQAIVSQSIQDPQLRVFFEWVDCKAKSVNTQFPTFVTRAFYFSLGLNQVLGHIGSNFSLALSLEPNFCRTISLNSDLTLDLSLFHILNLTRNLELISRPALIFQRSFNRAIAHALKVKPELAKELKSLKQELPQEEDNATLFWLWWHKSGAVWADRLSAAIVKYRNLGYKWRFDARQQQLLKQYYQANQLIVNGLNLSRHVSSPLKETIRQTLLISTEFEPLKPPPNIESLLRQSLT